MKAEERHELQENVLANILGNVLKAAAPYQTLILGLVVVLIALWLGISSLQTRSDAMKALGWTELFSVTNPEDLNRIASKHAGTIAGAWALQRAADLNLRQGGVEMYRDRSKAGELLEKARETYRKVTRSTENVTLLQRAEYGVAQTSEALEEFSEAKKHYELITTRWPNSLVAEYAADRLRQLNDPATIEFYSWFIQQPPPITDEMLNAGAGAASGNNAPDRNNAPAILDPNLSTEPDIDLPSAFDEPAAGVDTSTEPAETAPESASP